MQTLVVSEEEKLASLCESQSLSVDGNIIWAAPASAEQVAEANHQIGLQGRYSEESAVISDIIVIAKPPIEHAVPAPSQPQPSASAESAVPKVEVAPVSPPVRGAWLWSPQLWQQSADFIWQAQAQQGLSEVYISVPVLEDGRVAKAEQLAQFIAGANERALDVWVVIGDPHDVLPSSLPAIENRIQAFLRYNREATEAARLAGLQLDIEPYLLPGFGRAHGYWRDRYADVIQHIHAMLDGQLSLDLVMPAWWGIHPAWGEQLFSQLPTTNTRFNIMNYHTEHARLRTNAAPFLLWGQRHSIPVIVALEAGALPDESHRRYTQHERKGELWLLELGSEFIFALFDTPQTDLPGQAFTYHFEYVVPATDYTFNGDVERLNRAAQALSREWQTWSAFAGIAIHGLDDSNVLKERD